MIEIITGILATIMNIALRLVIPGGIMVIIGLIGKEVFKYAKTLQVTGGANQWVVVMSNGVMK